MTTLPEALLEPSFARCPEMVSTSPSFNWLLVIPRRCSMPGGEAEKPQLLTLPFSSFTSRYSQIWGLVHSSLVSTPVNFTGLVVSNSAVYAWCACATRIGSAILVTNALNLVPAACHIMAAYCIEVSGAGAALLS